MENSEIQRAWQIIANTNASLFLTGKAGTGKTTFLRRLCDEIPKRVVVCAPTGIAAINAHGVTLHSMFQLPFTPFVPDAMYNANRQKFAFSKRKVKLIRSIDVLVIDEVSMVRADVLDAVDSVLRRYRQGHLPFGGVQLLLIGDLQQLSPVAKGEEWDLLQKYYATPYFFSSLALRHLPYYMIELTKVYRQRDEVFLSLLNSVREGLVDGATLAQLNQRYIKDFNPSEEDGYIRLTSHNRQADLINQAELEKLKTHKQSFMAQVSGDFPAYSYPTEERLTLKIGAQVMFIRNDADQRYYNGMIGKVKDFGEDYVDILPVDSLECVRLEATVWENIKYSLDEETKEIKEEVIGTFKQLPLRLPWAITIHNSQGLTFDRAIIDAHQCFAPGQVYVALSRCRTLEGMVLSHPLNANVIMTDGQVNSYNRQMLQNVPNEGKINDLKKRYFKEVLKSAFDFHTFHAAYESLQRVLEEHVARLYPKQVESFRGQKEVLERGCLSVGDVFCQQIEAIVNDAGDEYESSAFLNERIHKASVYFKEQMHELSALVAQLDMPTESKKVKQLFEAAHDKLKLETRLMLGLLTHLNKKGFQLTEFVRMKADLLDADEGDEGKAERPSKKEGRAAKAELVPEDILHPEVFEALRLWRLEKSRELKLAAYVVLSQRALVGLSNLLPTTDTELKKVPYVGKIVAQKYGAEILEIIFKYKKRQEDKSS